MKRFPDIPQYEVKLYNPEFICKIQELFRNSFGGRNISEKSLFWQLAENPSAQNRAITLWDGDILVSYIALTPSYCSIKGETTLCAIAGTNMSHEDYLGVSIQLMRECNKKNSDIPLIYGFPNKNAAPIEKYHGHHMVGEIAFWTIKPTETGKNSKIKEFTEFTDQHGELYKQLVGSHYFIKHRSKEFLNWRVKDYPNVDYHCVQYEDNGEIKGYAVYSLYKEGEELHFQIVDIVAPEHEVFKELIMYLVGKAFELKADLVKLWMTSAMYKEDLEAIGFEYGLHPFKMTVWQHPINIEECYFTMIDSDIF